MKSFFLKINLVLLILGTLIIILVNSKSPITNKFISIIPINWNQPKDEDTSELNQVSALPVNSQAEVKNKPRFLIPINWNKPKNVGKPGRRQVATGGSRGSCGDLLSSQKNEKGTLTALVPIAIEGLTNSNNPTFFVYLPYQSKENYNYEFILLNEEEEEIYKVKLPIKPTPGIINIPLPNNVSIEKGQTYSWTFSFIFAEANTPCNPSQIPITETVEGAVSLDKITPNDTVLKQLETANIEEKITIYTEQGWWYDALASLAKLRQEYPDDSNVLSAWTEFLKVEQLENLATEKILP
ncbi:DUF928 domain-containing protein [Geminocystis sp. GBBB08]|uniref:DUF928 domain-containing protein n=1 Tax=Geminocystis sp. GBBB08 TaxID=2604140 RepID=UPI0027E2FD77|nr:DUF928 domain-containing protein [Geminocystis sp. GBBB08]MBL1208246.1 DUF928 domain-containing protein [Geminocystis sp. GBBB08]